VFHFHRGLQEIQQAEKLTGVKVISTTPTSQKPKVNSSKPPVALTKKEAKIYKLYMQSNQSLTKTQMNKTTGISRTIIDSMFKKTGIKYHRAQPKKVSSFPKEKSVQITA
jgi:predicted DNA-binding transcriptional regulator AlpA